MRLSSWNIEGRLSDEGLASKRGTAKHILVNLALSDFDVAFLPDAYSSLPNDDIIQDLENIVGEQGEIVSYGYNDLAESKSKLNGMLLSKLPIENKEIIKAGDYRNVIKTMIGGLAIYGVHLDDKSEATRHIMSNSIIMDIEKTKIPTVVMGDFNAAYPDGLVAKGFKALGNLHPNSSDGLLRRAKDMVNGGTMDMFLQAGFSETNPNHTPTETPKMRGLEFMPSIPLLQLDHILISSELDYDNFKIEQDGGSDHRQISAEISLR